MCNSTTGMRVSLACNASAANGVPESPCHVEWQLQLLSSSASQGCSRASNSTGALTQARLLADASGSVTTLQSWLSLPASTDPSIVLPLPLLFDGQVCMFDGHGLI